MSEPFDLDHFKVIRKIESSSFCHNYIVVEKKTDLVYLAKISRKSVEDNQNSEELEQNLNSEVKILSKLYHPSIIKLIGYSPIDFKGEYKPTIITDYYTKGTLAKFIGKKSQESPDDDELNDTRKLIILYGIATGMSYLHSHQIVHRNLKPSNILIDRDFTPKITDFGFSKIFHQEFTIAAYSSPEALTNSEYTEAGDVYSFSILAYELLTAKNPFKNLSTNELIEKVSKGIRPDINVSIPDCYKSLITRCWSQESSARPTFDQIVEELKTDSKYVTEKCERDVFMSYVEYIDHCQEMSQTAKSTSFSFDYFLMKNSPGKNVSSPASKQDSRHLFHVSTGDNECTAEELYGKGVMSTQDKKKAASYFKMAARKGHSKSMYLYGKMLYEGDGVIRNRSEGAKYIKSAAHNGDVDAMFAYGKMVKDGEVFEVDAKKASRYLKKAADKGQPEAMFTYGEMLRRGEGVAKDEEESLLYMQVSAHKGNIDAMCRYGLMLLNGEGSKVDKKKAAKYLKCAADEGNKKAAKSYAEMLAGGEGVKMNKAMADKYLAMVEDDVFESVSKSYSLSDCGEEEEGDVVRFGGFSFTPKNESKREIEVAFEEEEEDDEIMSDVVKDASDGRMTSGVLSEEKDSLSDE